MKFAEIFEAVIIALNSIRANKMRSLLASLGVVIGISVVIIMGWVLTALDDVLAETFSMMGADAMTVSKWDWSGGKKWEEVMARKAITYQQAEKFCEKIKSAEVATPYISNGGTIKYKTNKIESMVSVSGTKSEYGLTSSGEVSQGRYFNKSEEHVSSNVVVIGHGINELLFPENDALGKTIKVNGYKFVVIGVIKKQGTAMMDFMDNQVFTLGAYSGMFGISGRSFSIIVKPAAKKKWMKLRLETEGIMRSVRNIKPGAESDFSINESKTFEETFAKIQTYVWGVGIGMTSLSFLVGIIGIMNIMFVAVAERTKEIGIRKALGAPRRSIMVQFIVEATTLCVAGSILSLIFCSGLVFAVATIAPKYIPECFLSPVMPLKLFIVATFVSVCVGLLAGLIPAYRAAKLDVVDSLRSD